jgi:metal transporter CNNM
MQYFLGLTIGLMTLDEINLELIAKCGNPKDREYASKIIPIRKDGYFLLVSLLLANTVSFEYFDLNLSYFFD